MDLRNSERDPPLNENHVAVFPFFFFFFLPDVSFASFTFGRSECGLAIGSGVFKVTLSEEGVKILVLCFVDFLSILLLFFAP